MYNIQQGYYSLSYRIFNQYIPNIESTTGKKYDVVNLLVKRETLAFPPYEAVPVTLDIEPFVCACYGGAFSFRTMNVIKLRLGTPSDRLDLVYSSQLQKENLLTQVEFVSLFLERYIRDSDLALSFFPQVFTSDQGYATLEVRITRYNISTAWYDPFPNSDDVIVYVSMTMAYSMQTGALVTATTAALTGVKNIELFLKPDSNGTVTIHGLKPYSSGLVRAYVINKTSGAIEYSYDVGTYGAPASPATLPDKRTFLVMNRNTVKYVSMFPAGSIVLYYMVDPKTFSVPTASGISTSGLVSPTLQVYNFFAHGWTINYAVETMWPDLMVFAQTDIPIEIVLTTGGKAIAALLLNSSESKPYGSGYTLKFGDMIILKNTPGTIAKNMFLVADDRVRILEGRYTFNPLTRLYHSYARLYNEKLAESYAKRDYSSVYADSFSMWSFSLQSYGVTMGFMWEVLVTAVVFFLTVIPFAFIMRSLLSEAGGLKGLLLMATVFLSCAAFLHVFHPAFSIATNIYIVLLSFLISLVIGILLFFVSEELSMTTSIIKRRITGAYFEKVSKFDFLVNAMGIGLKNMRARKVRTALTLTSITIVVFSLMVFSSVTTARVLIATPSINVPEGYEGLYIRGASGWEDVIPEELYYYLKNKYHENAVVTARAWFYFPVGSQGPRFKFFTNGSAFVTCLLGLMPEEKYITNIDQNLISGSRWFENDDLYTCIIGEDLASALSKDTGAPFGVGNEIEIWGVKLKVIGILRSSFTGTDLDGQVITPVSKEPQAANLKGFELPRYSWNRIVIVPYKFIAEVLTQRPEIHTISAKFTDVYGSTRSSAEELALSSSLDVFFASESKAYVIRPRDMPSAVGVNLTLPTIFIAMTIILNMILGSLYERTKEIGIYSSVGFSPTHISGSFFVEMISYSLASGILGYVLGVGVSYWLWSINWYPPELYSNFSSVNMILILALNFLVTMSATVYPAIKASRIVTPSLQRKWSMPSPKGSEWRIPLPFASGSLEETFGMMMFLKRWFDIHSTRDAGNFLSLGNNFVMHEESGRKTVELMAEVRLPPYDAGIVQHAHILAVETKGQTYEFEIYIVRISGMENQWKTSNRNFIDELRKRLLVWRSLSTEEKAKYVEMFQEFSDVKGGE
jgi:ABC-type antimicrobial peptide transport system permease subunit